MVDKNLLALGKVFSTLALLGYIFNFSILFSNYAIEALNALSIFFTRVDESIMRQYEESVAYKRAIKPIKHGLEFDDVEVSWHKDD